MAKKPYGASAYQAAQLTTTPPLQALVLLYDAAIRHMRLFLVATENKDAPLQLEETKKAVRILEGLNQALDMEKGGTVAVRLRDTSGAVSVALYRCVGRPEAAEACEKLIRAVSTLRDAWAEIAGVPLLDPSRAGPPPSVEIPKDQPDAGAR